MAGFDVMISAPVLDLLAASWRMANCSLERANLAGGPATRLLARLALDGYFDLVERVVDDVNKRLEERRC